MTIYVFSEESHRCFYPLLIQLFLFFFFSIFLCTYIFLLLYKYVCTTTFGYDSTMYIANENKGRKGSGSVAKDIL